MNLTTRERRIAAYSGAGLAAITALASLAIVHDRLTDVHIAFAERYTNDGECLSDTPFDTDNGAVLDQRIIDGQTVLTVTPEHAESYTPSTLNFVYTVGKFSVEMNFADTPTGTLLSSACGENSGY